MTMVKIKTKNGYSMKVIVVISVLSFAGISLASNGDEDLLKQAKQIFSPLPQVMSSDKNPITLKK